MNTQLVKRILLPLAAIAMVGCAQQSTDTAMVDTSKASGDAGKMKMRMAELERREAALKQQEMALANRASAPAPAPMASADGSGLLPPDPRPGECYARVVVPAKYSTSTKTIVKREASERIEVIPAKYGPVTERVLVREASTRLEVIPPQYETVEERILVRPASENVVQIPPTYKTVSERILVKPATTEWKRGTGVGSGAGAGSAGSAAAFVQRFGGQRVIDTRVEDTGEILCLVEVPAVYKTVTKEVIATPATTRAQPIPADYRTIKKTVLKTPPSTREVQIPAEYKTVTVTKLIQPATERRIPVPEQKETVTLNEKVGEERVEWRPVLCEVNMTAQNVSKLQSALQKNGCYKCRIDGVMGRCTLDAARCYAEPKGLPWGKNYVTIQVIRALGLKF